MSEESKEHKAEAKNREEQSKLSDEQLEGAAGGANNGIAALTAVAEQKLQAAEEDSDSAADKQRDLIDQQRTTWSEEDVSSPTVNDPKIIL